MPSAPVEIPWPVTAQPGQNIGEGQGDLINAFAVRDGDILRVKRLPGLRREYAYSGLSLVSRGMHAIPSRRIDVWGGKVETTYANGTVQPIANALPGTDRVTIASNLREDPLPQVVIVANTGAFVVDLDANEVNPYPDPDLGPVIGVEYYAGYFFFPKANGDIIASDLQSLDIDPLSKARAEYAADGLLRLKSTGATLIAFGEKTSEVWADIGASPFPAVRQTAIDVGLIGKWAVAGGANEWEHGLLWAAADCTVRKLNGIKADIVSNADVAADLTRAKFYPEEIVAKVYGFGQQAIWSVTCERFGWTWEYNVLSGAWHRRDSYGSKLWRPQHTINWRGKWLSQDTRETGLIFDIVDGYFAEDTADPLVKERMRSRIESGPIKQFPANIRLPSIDIDCTVGLGRVDVPSPFETDPAVMVSWSHDGGAHWANPLARSLGKAGRYATKVTVNNLGRSTQHGTRIRLDIVDPVPFVLTSAISTRTRASRPRQVGA